MGSSLWRRTFGILSASVVIGASACGGDDGEDVNFDDIRTPTGLTNCTVAAQGYYYVGAILSYSGTNTTGTPREQAIIQAVQDVNLNKVGVHGRRLGLIRCDTASLEANAAAAVTELLGMDPPVAGIIGGSRSAEVIAEAPVAATGGVVLVAGSATSPSITNLADDGWVSRVAPSDAAQGAVLAGIVKADGYTRAFVINSSDAYGTGFQAAFNTAFTAGGGTSSNSTFAANFATGNTAAQVVTAAKAFNDIGAGAGILIGFPPEGAAIINQAASASYSPTRWYFGDALRQQAFVDGVAGKGIFTTAKGTVPSTPTSDAATGFVDRYTTTWGEAPASFGANHYDALMLIALGMQIANDPENHDQVKAGLAETNSGTAFAGDNWVATKNTKGKAMNYDGASGPVDFDANGDIVANIDTWNVNASNAIAKTGCFTSTLTSCP
jgi:branched-chain amino acid transport system substrate-binding protein